MGSLELYFCATCGKLARPRDLAAGLAGLREGRTLCAGCFSPGSGTVVRATPTGGRRRTPTSSNVVLAAPQPEIVSARRQTESVKPQRTAKNAKSGKPDDTAQQWN